VDRTNRTHPRTRTRFEGQSPSLIPLEKVETEPELMAGRCLQFPGVAGNADSAALVRQSFRNTDAEKRPRGGLEVLSGRFFCGCRSQA
jgi:hypothetical protein